MMTLLVDKLADLTALRDRQLLDMALVDTIDELVHPLSVAIFRLVGRAGNEHWLTCAQKKIGLEVPSSAAAWVEMENLPLAEDFPQRQSVIASNRSTLAEVAAGVSIFPINVRAGASGVLELSTQTAPTQELEQLISGVLRLYQNFQGLLDYGERDALTELLNRKTFDGSFLKATLAQQQAQNSIPDERRYTGTTCSYWLAMLDIDHFKHVNDNFGHLIGDEVLLLLARLMRSCFRFHDQLYRFGGEEFVVLMRCNTDSQARLALQRLRIDTEVFAFPQVGHITVSIGFTEVKHGDTPGGAFERADKAVYYAKEHGRNQVCSYENLVERGELIAEVVNSGDIELF
jgi:diguanylate cyclase (GGDEF)-like protein